MNHMISWLIKKYELFPYSWKRYWWHNYWCSCNLSKHFKQNSHYLSGLGVRYIVLFFSLWLRVYSRHKIRRVSLYYPWAIVHHLFTYIVILFILLIWFHHMDTILVVLLVVFNLTLYLMWPYWMRTIFHRFYPYNVVL